jgi:poly-beta-1,6-N-acetyl-D-glucosamine synthase
MFWLKLVFWLSLFILFYCFIGYTVVLWLAVQVKKIILPSIQKNNASFSLPDVTLIIAAYNEKDFIEQKIINTLSLDYPKEKIKYLFITDGSNDGTDDVIKKYPDLILLHLDERKGKSAALNRAMQTVISSIVVFSDANTLLNKEAIHQIVKHYQNPKVGGVSGEKKIETSTAENKTGLGEGMYWQYESHLKNLESGFYSLVGSAGELFSLRTSLFKTIPENIILDDFYTALKINEQGYKIAYEPGAVATEAPSASLKEEQKRKVRIASGAFQLASQFTGLLNVFKYPAFAFQFASHKILRWFLAPVCIVALFVTGFLFRNETVQYQYLFYAQLCFYTMALLGWQLNKIKIILPLFYFPFYFLFMNYCNLLGWLRYLSGKENVLWEKAERQRM